MKQTAAISALFIFVNSLSGLAGQLTKGINFTPICMHMLLWLAGGICGACLALLNFGRIFEIPVGDRTVSPRANFYLQTLGKWPMCRKKRFYRQLPCFRLGIETSISPSYENH
jgi:hypothetical protein